MNARERLLDELLGSRSTTITTTTATTTPKTIAPSFDGGARPLVPPKVDPAEDHDRLVVALASAALVHRGLTF